MTAGIAHRQFEIGVGLLGALHQEHGRFRISLRKDAAARVGVECELGVDQPAMVLDDRGDAGRVRLLVAAEEDNEIAAGHELLGLEPQERRGQGGDPGLVVGAPAAEEEAVLLDQRNGSRSQSSRLAGTTSMWR